MISNPRISLIPHDAPNPGEPPKPMKVLERWSLFLGEIAGGTPLPDAMLKCYINRAQIEACTRNDPLEYQRFQDALRAAKRVSWSVFDINAVMELIAQGVPTRKAVQRVTGTDGDTGEARYQSFMAIVNNEPDVRKHFLESKEIQQLTTSEQLQDIADDDSNDTLDTGGKSGRVPNNAAVNRSKLRVDTAWRTMAAFNKRFSEARNQTEVTVNINRAEVLEEARERARNKGKVTKQDRLEAVDAEFTPVAVEKLDTSWMDEAPKDPIWREES